MAARAPFSPLRSVDPNVVEADSPVDVKNILKGPRLRPRPQSAATAPRLRTFSLAPDPLPPRQLPAGLAGNAGSSAGGDDGSGDGSSAAVVAVAAAAAEAAAEAGAAARRRVCAGILRRSAKRAGCTGWSMREWGDDERPSDTEAGSPCGACGGARGGSCGAELPALFAPEGEAEPLAVLHLFASLHTLIHSRTPPR